MKKLLILAGTVAVLVVGFAAAMVSYRADRADAVGSQARDDIARFVPDDAMIRGEPTADVTIVEFFDPACETCATFYPHLEKLLAANPGRIRLVMRYAPFHPGSEDIVAILEASRAQGQYWETLETLYASQPVWASHHDPRPEKVWEILGQSGLDVERLQWDVGSEAIATTIARDRADAQALGVRKTPEFFVNGKPLPRFGLDELKALVRAELAAGP